MSRRPALPTLDFLKGFDAAARHLSFTRAAEELFLTQSALSRQIKTLEDEIGVELFERGHRELKLTAAGESLRRVVRGALSDLAQTVAAIRTRQDLGRLTVSTTVPFASLWLVPRLPRFRAQHPEVEVFVSADNRLLDLERAQVDVAIRYTGDNAKPEGAERLFGERVLPVASPAVAAALQGPEDLAKQVLLHLEDPLGRVPWVDWSLWLTAHGLADLAPAGNLRFSQYDLMLQCAMDGQGVALGRRPLIDHWLESGRLVAPFAQADCLPRAYFVLAASHAKTRAEVSAFIAWLKQEAQAASIA
jgi:DNA-binding transcriptional LysR family regulator